jgi:hypothetical protein
MSLDVPATLHSGLGTFARGRIVDASLSGALVRTHVKLPVLARVTLELAGGGTAGVPHLVQGYVVRHSESGLALEWTEFSPPAIAALLYRAAATLQVDCERNPRPDNRYGTGSVRGAPPALRPTVCQ